MDRLCHRRPRHAGRNLLRDPAFSGELHRLGGELPEVLVAPLCPPPRPTTARAGSRGGPRPGTAAPAIQLVPQSVSPGTTLDTLRVLLLHLYRFRSLGPRARRCASTGRDA